MTKQLKYSKEPSQAMPTETNSIASIQADFYANEPFVGLYTMYYRHPQIGNHLLVRNFRFNGNLKDARARAQQHCDILNLKLNFVEPMITDLKKAEEAYLGANRETAAAAAHTEETKK